MEYHDGITWYHYRVPGTGTVPGTCTVRYSVPVPGTDASKIIAYLYMIVRTVLILYGTWYRYHYEY